MILFISSIHRLIFESLISIGRNKCAGKNEDARFVDIMSCCHFYRCTSGKLIRQTCTYPNLFDIQTRTCLSYKRVKCDGRRQCLSKCT